MTRIRVQGLVKRYPRSTDLLQFLRHPRQREEVTALDGIDLQLVPGRIHGLVGPNGAGKTTLLKILAGLVLPTSGRIELDGADVTDDARTLRESVGLVVADERTFFWRLTVRENLRFFAALQGLDPRQRDGRLERCMAEVGLEDVAMRSFRELSTGMRQRVAIARGLLGEPPVLLLDEATRSLDPEAAQNVRGLVRELARAGAGRTVVYATHVLSEVEELCDEVFVLRQGRIAVHESLSEPRHDGRYRIRTSPAVPDNLLEGLQGVEAVRREGEVLILRVAHEGALRALVDRVGERGLCLTELTPLERSIEDLVLGKPGEERS